MPSLAIWRRHGPPVRAAFLVFSPLFLENLPVVDRPKVFFNLPEMQNHRNRRNPKPIQLDVFESFVWDPVLWRKAAWYSVVEICCPGGWWRESCGCTEGSDTGVPQCHCWVCPVEAVGFVGGYEMTVLWHSGPMTVAGGGMSVLYLTCDLVLHLVAPRWVNSQWDLTIGMRQFQKCTMHFQHLGGWLCRLNSSIEEGVLILV